MPETNLELIVAKRVPFRIAVEMDERKINQFIAVCANSEFVFEINQLRVNRHTPNEKIVFNGGGSGAGDPSKLGGMGAGGSLGAAGGGLGGGSAGASSGLKPTSVESRTDFIVSVEFYGVVKIYNPVRENFLRLAAGQQVVDETADPAMEAAPDAAPPAAPAAGVTPEAAPAAVEPAEAG